MSDPSGERAFRYWVSIWRDTDFFAGSVGDALLWAESEIASLRAAPPSQARPEETHD